MSDKKKQIRVVLYATCIVLGFVTALICYGVGLAFMGYTSDTACIAMVMVGPLCFLLARRLLARTARPIVYSAIFAGFYVLLACIQFLSLLQSQGSVAIGVLLLSVGASIVLVTALDSLVLKPTLGKQLHDRKLFSCKRFWIILSAGVVLLSHGVLAVLFILTPAVRGENESFRLLMYACECVFFCLYLATYDLVRKYTPFKISIWITAFAANIPFFVAGYVSMYSTADGLAYFAFLEWWLLWVYGIWLVCDLIYLVVDIAREKRKTSS